MLSTLIFILVLSFLVIIHELGHFIVARVMKIKVEEFGLGYPPLAVKLFRKWGSDFTLNWIPFGGFVRMEGEDGASPAVEAQPVSLDKRRHDGPFYEKSAAARLAVILAGATVNFIFGVIAFSVVFSLVGIPRQPTQAVVAEVRADSPAAQAGLQPQTAIIGMITSTGSIPIKSYDEVVKAVNAHKGETVTLQLQGPCQRDVCQEKYWEVTVRLRTDAQTPAGSGSLGVSFEQEVLTFYPWYQMPFRGAWFGIQQAVLLGWSILQALGSMVHDLVTRGILPSEVAGPVGIIHQASSSGVLTQGILSIILFAGMLSINLAIMNVLPIPALDGGRAVFILLEMIVGKKRVQAVEGYANYGGYALLLGLIILVTARDIFRIITGG